ncbi:MAG TPA: sigma-70 family RNA polymerase sigma factor [Candidatus Binatia bacterium]|nr:sigma-70 family RNA polymerase sigma factor [Candidatus Binatia bacterium]
MQEQSDVQLLRDFAERGDETAFREIVARYANLVYSAALRQVNSSDSACELAQDVFCDLARKARQLAEKMTADGSLAGWLHRSMRYAALNHLRDARRRLNHEREAMEQLLANSEPGADWEQIRPALDEALDSLDDADREAILLRYFKNQDFRTVGLALGVSDDAAQKRVSRAVERLREFFSKRNVTVGTGTLAVLISANAVQSAPIGLVAAISTAALAGTAAATTSTIISATKTLAMTTLQKTLVTATVAALAGAGVYESHQAAQLHEHVQSLQQQQAPLVEQTQQLRRERNDVTNQLAGLMAENAQLRTSPKELELLKLRGEVTVLRYELNKQMAANQTSNSGSAGTEESPYKRQASLLMRYFSENPDARIPEMDLLSKEATYSASIFGLAVKLAAQSDLANYGQQGVFDENRIKLETDEEYRRAASELRSYAEYSLAPMFCSALNSFLAKNNGAYPTTVSELQPFFSHPIDQAILQRYEIQPASNFSKIQSKYDPSGRIIGMVITPKAAIDEDFDHRIIIGPTNFMVGDAGSYK